MRIHGKRSRLYVGIASDTAAAEPLPFTTNWTVEIKSDVVDVTACGDSNKNYASKRPEITGTFQGFHDTATAQTYTAAADGLARRFYLYPTTPSSTGPYWFGTAVFDFAADGAVGGSVNVAGDWSAEYFWGQHVPTWADSAITWSSGSYKWS